MQLIRDIILIYKNYGYTTQVLTASVRHPMHVVEAAKAGSHVATIPFKVLDMAPPTSVAEFRNAIRAIFERLDAHDDLARVAMASPAATQARSATMPDRLRFTRQFVGTIAPELPKTDRDRIARVMVVLTMSSALRTWRDHLGASVDDAADDVEWTLRSLIAASRPRSDR